MVPKPTVLIGMGFIAGSNSRQLFGTSQYGSALYISYII
jgi:hypothetical protein